ncbi:MAG: SH3 domain-containing protein [Firmicutes bacterium]|nr:SH3 domain-containing protein [Bacillota bacterium]
MKSFHVFRTTVGILLIFCLAFCSTATLLADGASEFDCGDVNRDGSIDVKDAILMLQSIVGINPLDDEAEALADVYRDEVVDVSDVITILRYVVGIVTELPVYPDPTYVPDHRVKSNGYLYGLDFAKDEVPIIAAPDSLPPGDYIVKDDYTFYLIDGTQLINKGRFYYMERLPYAMMRLDVPADPQVTATFLQNRAASRRSDSPFRYLGSDFIRAQETWGVNALYLMAHAALESAWGTSRIARDKNNIYGYKAYDSDPYNYAGTFRSVPDCIIYVSGYIRSAYLSEGGQYFYGPNLDGMNTRYATDPMWRVKIANIMESLLPSSQYQPVQKTYNSGRVCNVDADSHLNLRSGAGTDHGIVATLKNKAEVTILGMARLANGRNWYKLQVPGHEGWACGDFIELITQPRGAVFLDEWYLTDRAPSSLNVRSAPSTASQVKGSLDFGTGMNIEKIQLVGNDLWYKINYEGSSGDCWILGNYAIIDW